MSIVKQDSKQILDKAILSIFKAHQTPPLFL
jgi:hypothetical protein